MLYKLIETFLVKQSKIGNPEIQNMPFILATLIYWWLFKMLFFVLVDWNEIHLLSTQLYIEILGSAHALGHISFSFEVAICNV